MRLFFLEHSHHHLFGTYVAVSQTVYAPPPASYYKAGEVKDKCAATLAAI